MREIKFRGWHTKLKKMFSAEGMAEDQLTLLPTGSFINVSGDSTKLSEIYPRDKFIPLQYTGLKDKNGKEIFEGDILKVKDTEKDAPSYDNSGNYEVIWNGIGGYGFSCGSEPNLWNNIRYEYEIIGNKFENPELLTKK